MVSKYSKMVIRSSFGRSLIDVDLWLSTADCRIVEDVADMCELSAFRSGRALHVACGTFQGSRRGGSRGSAPHVGEIVRLAVIPRSSTIGTWIKQPSEMGGNPNYALLV